MRAARVAPLVAALAVGALVAPGDAAPAQKPQITDPAGDALPTKSQDVLSVLYRTAGTGSGKAYRPKALLVTMTLAAPPSAVSGFNYETEAATDTCGDVTLNYAPGTPYEAITGLSGWVDWGSCGGDERIALLSPAVSGNTITWKLPLSSATLRAGALLSDFRARVDPANPAVPLPSSATASELGLLDSATGSGTWRLR